MNDCISISFPSLKESSPFRFCAVSILYIFMNKQKNCLQFWDFVWLSLRIELSNTLITFDSWVVDLMSFQSCRNECLRNKNSYTECIAHFDWFNWNLKCFHSSVLIIQFEVWISISWEQNCGKKIHNDG